MNISIHVPDDLEPELKAAFGPNLSQSAWEALVVEGYRTRKLGIGQVMKLLKLESRFHAEEWLANLHVAANYSEGDLELDRQNLNAIFGN